MGVVNVTPDSFSDGGRWADPDRAVAHGLELVAQGADLLDIGGESTRPGATRPLLAEELGRVVPVIRALAATGVPVSVDTMRAEVAQAALDAGASVVNDVSGGLADPRILEVAAAAGATYVAMHWRAHSDRMADFASYPAGVVTEVADELAVRRDAALAAGVAPERLVLDPGLGFAKRAEHNWELLAGLDRIAALGHRLLVGGSRKTFLGRLLAEGDQPRAVDGREAATTALTLLLADAGAWCVRVHDVRASRDALAVREAWHSARASTSPTAAPPTATPPTAAPPTAGDAGQTGPT
ncbi:dihydropteroate synthase [Nocardioides sp. ChNu-153]|uniref:dihydropteroate synthase n=1 Tax=unclassified Nocardioides TaxID=2615069 RepID=UPI002405F175|nr:MULTISPECIES: dihydropteroate synthase [unclassified Nocardioides]MDF9716262.1 dihydropteroate synthase [Nocardioides sp. ChNu-99]MDN7121996.1 dihydropteroate synthase [Nocardioides sp. ChNu-153]